MNEDAVKRLKTIEGHVRGIEQMVENGVYCIDVIKQIQAVQAALDKVSNIILEGHLHTCVITALRLVPKNLLIFRFCLMFLKNVSMSHRAL